MKYLSPIFIIYLLLSTTCSAADSNARQAWDVVHVTGSALGTAYLNHAGLSWWQAAGVMFIAGLAWESCDELARCTGYRNDLFDWREGFSRNDVIRNSIGITLSIPIRR